MARTPALNIETMAGGKADLREIHSLLIENVQKRTLSTALKSNAYSGNPQAGSVEFKRFANALVNPYGTARAAGKGDPLREAKVIVNLDIDREIIEEVEHKDIQTYGVPNLIARRVPNHINSMVSELDTAFFAKAKEEGTEHSATGTPVEVIESAVATLETLKNDYMRGMSRDQIEVVVTPAVYGQIRTYLDRDVNNSHVTTAAEEFGLFHGIRIYQSINMPADCDYVVMANQSIAQPIIVNQYAEPEKIPFADSFAVSLFFYYGTKVITPELVLWGAITAPAGE